MTEFVCDPGPADRPRLAAHLAESRRLATAQAERMDACMFRLPLGDVAITTPWLAAVDAIVAAAGKPGPLRATLPSLSVQDAYLTSYLLECARDRAAGRGWQDGDGEAARGIEAIRVAFDAQSGVTGDPGERAWARTAAAHKPGKAKRVRYGAPAFFGEETA